MPPDSPRGPTGADAVNCSFCGKSADQVNKVVAGPNNVYICDECVSLCVQIMEGAPEDAR